MDKLPTFLVKSIVNACELFTNVTYTVHGDDKKARISIMFAQNDNKQTVCKSKSTVSRDHRRMEKYNSKIDNINQSVDISATMIQNEKAVLLNKVDDIDNVCEMDIDKNILQSDNTDNIEVEINNITNNNEELAEIVTDNSADEAINNTNETLDVSENKIETDAVCQNIDGKKERNEHQTSINSNMVISKVVLKHIMNSPALLIGKITGSSKLVLCNLKTNRMFKASTTHPYYNNYLRNVDKDLTDVRENPSRPPYIDDAIEEMTKLALDNDLHGH